MSTSVAVLHSARVLYERSPSHVSLDSVPEEGSYCAVTALSRAWHQHDCPGSLWTDYIGRVAQVVGESLALYNAEHSTEDVLRAFDKAIDLAAAEASEASDA